MKPSETRALLQLEELDAIHRVTIEAIAERLTEVGDVLALGDKSLKQLGDQLRDLMGFELITIPAGAVAKPCRWCDAPIYWVPSRAIKRYRESVSIAGPECAAPSAAVHGRGFAHIVDCFASGLRFENDEHVARLEAAA